MLLQILLNLFVVSFSRINPLLLHVVDDLTHRGRNTRIVWFQLPCANGTDPRAHVTRVFDLIVRDWFAFLDGVPQGITHLRRGTHKESGMARIDPKFLGKANSSRGL